MTKYKYQIHVNGKPMRKTSSVKRYRMCHGVKKVIETSEPYFWDTYEEAHKMARMCYPDDYHIDPTGEYPCDIKVVKVEVD